MPRQGSAILVALLVSANVPGAGCSGGCSKKSGAAAMDAAASPSESAALGEFEGTVTTHVTSASARIDEDVTYTVKGRKGRRVRIDTAVPGRPKLRGVVDSFAGHTMLINILDDVKAFTVAELTTDAGRPETWEHRKLGTVVRVADHDCVEWEAHAPGRTVVACMADPPLFDTEVLAAVAPVPQPWLAGMAGFPLRSVERDDDGRELAKMDVTRIARQPVDEELLVIPKTYRRMDADTPNVTTGRMRK